MGLGMSTRKNDSQLRFRGIGTVGHFYKIQYIFIDLVNASCELS